MFIHFVLPTIIGVIATTAVSTRIRLVVICIVDEYYTPPTTVERISDLRIKQIRL